MTTEHVHFKIQIGEGIVSSFPTPYTTSDAARKEIRAIRKTGGMNAKHWQTVRLAVVKVTTTTQEIYVDAPTQQTEQATPPPDHF